MVVERADGPDPQPSDAGAVGTGNATDETTDAVAETAVDAGTGQDGAAERVATRAEVEP